MYMCMCKHECVLYEYVCMCVWYVYLCACVWCLWCIYVSICDVRMYACICASMCNHLENKIQQQCLNCQNKIQDYEGTDIRNYQSNWNPQAEKPQNFLAFIFFLGKYQVIFGEPPVRAQHFPARFSVPAFLRLCWHYKRHNAILVTSKG